MRDAYDTEDERDFSQRGEYLLLRADNRCLLYRDYAVVGINEFCINRTSFVICYL